MRGIRIVLTALMAVIMTVAISPSAHAQDATSPPAFLSNSPLVISAYSISGGMPHYIEIHNSSNDPVRISDWVVTISWSPLKGAPTGSVAPAASSIPIYGSIGVSPYIRPAGYAVAGFNENVSNALSKMTLEGVPAYVYVSEIRLENPNYRPYVRTLTEAQTVPSGAMRLNVGASGYTTTYGAINSDKLYQDEDYYYPPTGGFPLAPVEILANPESCSPLDTSGNCQEYIKFYNHLDNAVDFSEVRIRAGSAVVQLAGVIESGTYAIFHVGLPNTGGYVSLEDTYGLHTYANTIIEYPDASATSKKGKSWALVEDRWQWSTSNPRGPNIVPVVEEDVVAEEEESSLTPCRDDQYRNPETNRCKLIASTASSLKPCAANQVRNSETNRCRTISSGSSASSLKPCAANQYRNPETNRCRLIASTASSLKPCAQNQERNPATNRCRAVLSAVVPNADFPVEENPTSSDQSLGWIAFAGVGILALGYAGWEWRYEIAGISRKLKGLVTKA